MNANLAYWLAALHLPGVGPSTLLRWLEHFASIKKLFTASTEEWQAAGIAPKYISALQNPNWKLVEEALAWQKQDNYIITVEDDAYPQLLKEIYHPPLVLYVRGNKSAILQQQIAIVGSRQATLAGLKNAEHFAYCLAEAGLTITSGLALGIDAAGHKGALAAHGVTVGVAGTGLDYVYPRSHRPLVEDIITHQGAVISEFPLHTPPKAINFPRRNRIIGGLSMGVLVVEAVLKSGSLITARFALEQGRDVFAIPGSIHQPLARGCHYLIRQGAKLVETVDDILEELRPFPLSRQAPAKSDIKSPESLPEDAQRLLEQIGYEITPLDMIILRSGLTASGVSSILLILELNGYIQSVPGGYVRVLAN